MLGRRRSLYVINVRHPDQLLSSNAQYTAILVSRSGPQMADFGQIVSVRSVSPLFWHIFYHSELKGSGTPPPPAGIQIKGRDPETPQNPTASTAAQTCPQGSF